MSEKLDEIEDAKTMDALKEPDQSVGPDAPDELDKPLKDYKESIKKIPRKALAALSILAIITLAGGTWYVLHNHTHSTASTAKNGSTPDTLAATKDSSSAQQNAAGNSASNSVHEAPKPDNPGTTNAATQTANTTNISIKTGGFTPTSASTKKGLTVTWTNDDGVAHAISETDNQMGPRSPELKPGESYTYTFSQAGTFNYQDPLVPSLTGTVTVTN